MGRLENLRAELREWPDSDVVRLCDRILSFMDKLPSSQLEMLSLNRLLKAADHSQIDQNFVDALGLLVNTSVHALDAKGMFVDGNEDEFEISGDDIIRASNEKLFIHPRTGEPVNDFEQRIFPFYVLSEKFRNLR